MPPAAYYGMSRVFLLYMPPGNPEAMVHYEDTIGRRVPLQRIAPHLSLTLREKLKAIFGTVSIAVWGSAGGKGNRRTFDRMAPGDDVLIVEGRSIKLIGKVAAKVESLPLSRELWKPLSKGGAASWELIYFIANPREIDVPFAEFCTLFGYKTNLQLRGFTPVSPDRLEEFYAKYDDLYSILVKLQNGEQPAKRDSEIVVPQVPVPELAELTPDEIDEALRLPSISDHVRMQWTLARLGRKAGERVWVPRGDQAKLRRAFEFEDFDAQFAAGIDLPPSYMENIDVVWKQEFRIGAAYEVENSTAIYSGLLRFADLNVIAPNTTYPMFIVAPTERKGQVRAQLQRPAFKRLQLDKKVRYLSYEAIRDIDGFFPESGSGLTVDVIYGRSEQLT